MDIGTFMWPLTWSMPQILAYAGILVALAGFGILAFIGVKPKRKDMLKVGGVALLAVALFMGGVINMPQTASVSNNGGSSNSPVVVTTGVVLTHSVKDAFNLGTAVAATPFIGIAGSIPAAGVTNSFAQGAQLTILYNASGYHRSKVQYTTPQAVAGVVESTMKKNATVGITISNTNSQVASTNLGTNSNQTVVPGGPYNMKIRFDGQDQATTQDMQCIFEGSNKTALNTLSFTMSGLTVTSVGQSTPAYYTVSGGLSKVFVYDVSAIDGAVSPEGVISVTSANGNSLAGTTLKMVCYTKEHFIDSVNGVTYGVADSKTNAVQSMAQYPITVYFQ